MFTIAIASERFWFVLLTCKSKWHHKFEQMTAPKHGKVKQATLLEENKTSSTSIVSILSSKLPSTHPFQASPMVEHPGKGFPNWSLPLPPFHLGFAPFPG